MNDKSKDNINLSSTPRYETITPSSNAFNGYKKERT
jgi:hypothetical protein